MARPVTMLAIFFLAFNVFAGALVTTGIAATLGLDANVGGDEVQDTVPEERADTGAPTGSTLFGMYNVLAGQASEFFSAIFPGLAMLERAGAPRWILYGMLSPMFSAITFVGVMSYVRGWGL